MSDNPPPYAPLPTAPPDEQAPPYYGGTAPSAGKCCGPQPHHGGYHQQGHHTTVIATQPVAARQIVVGLCPACQRGVLEDHYSPLAFLLAICCFPAGLICCLLMRERRCSACGSTFSH
eukprot:m.307613 g.307613  ORF g.307613 m.307613 type:complete len:118 (+) comp42531_c0_seq1:93-446(+)